MGGGYETDDRDLFRAVMRDVKPLKHRVSGTSPPLGNTSEATASRKPGAENDRPNSLSVLSPQPKQQFLTHGDTAGLDRRTGQRFRRGQLPIEARLDLHGMYQKEAYRILTAFISGQQAQGRRCVIVVTGKGVGKQGGGVLRSAVPRWLNEVPNRDKVLAFGYARQRDGGVGALYLLLKRRRN